MTKQSTQLSNNLKKSFVLRFLQLGKTLHDYAKNVYLIRHVSKGYLKSKLMSWINFSSPGLSFGLLPLLLKLLFLRRHLFPLDPIKSKNIFENELYHKNSQLSNDC